MTVDFDDAVASSAAFLRRLRMDGLHRPNLRRACREESIRLELVAPHVLRGGHLARYNPIGDSIVRRRGLDERRDGFAIGHELGHRYWAKAGRPFGGEDEEAWCNVFAGALIMPREPLAAFWRRGHDLADLMEAYPHVSPTCIALRLGEARLAEVLVIQGTGLRYVRADVRPTDDLVQLGVEAARYGKAVRSGIGRGWRMADAFRRAAVIIDEAA